MKTQARSRTGSASMEHVETWVVASTSVSRCAKCHKPFTDENSLRRHVRYCGTRKRTRLRSCRACSAAKVKCSFGRPCVQCAKRHIACEYTEPFSASNKVTSVTAPPSNRALREHLSGLPSVAVGVDEGALLPFATRLSATVQVHDAAIPDLQSLPKSGLPVLPQPPVYSCDISTRPKWCTWAQRGTSFSILTNPPGALLNTQRNADVICQSLRAFPTMMLRRETFPWFIHPQMQLLGDSLAVSLPEPLSSCIGIAQMFVSRSEETRHVLWRTIRAEYLALNEKIPTTSTPDLLVASQACMIYLTMIVADASPQGEAATPGLMDTLQALYIQFKQSCIRGANGESELLRASPSWVDWIFAESQRRLAVLWFIIGVVLHVKVGGAFDPDKTWRALPLPSLKSLWEAKSQTEWTREYETSYALQRCGMANLGDLMDAQKNPTSPSNAQKLDTWNAGTDNLGTLLNLVGVILSDDELH